MTIGLRFLHQNSYIHCDMKMENILLSSDKRHIKISDFGLARRITVNYKNHPDTSKLTFQGTADYLAPEVFLGQEFNHKIDIWSLGVIFYELIVKSSPFDGNTEEEIFENSQKLKFQENILPNYPENEEQGSKLLENMLKIDVKQRFSCAEILEDDWMKMVSSSIDSQLEETEKLQLDDKIKLGDLDMDYFQASSLDIGFEKF